MSRDPFRNQISSRFSGSDFDPDDDAPLTSGGGLFLWTVILLLLVGVALACWIGSYYVFGHPEKPLSYSLLTKLKKLDPPKRFELTAAPRGEFLRSPQIYERFAKLTPRELASENERLLRNYLRNYKLTQDLVPYVVGTYNILDSFELTPSDFFESGAVALAQAKENSAVLLEQVFPADKKVVPTLQRTLLTGLDIDIKRENEISAIIHVDKLDDGRIKVTAVSILYPGYGSTVSAGTFSLEPPSVLNVEAGLPITTIRRQKDADQKYKSYRARAGLSGENPNASAPQPAQNRLMRVERPIAVNTPSPSPAPSASATPTPIPTPTPLPVKPTPAPVPDATPASAASTPAPAGPSSAPSPAAATSSDPSSAEGSWPVYAPGQMPRGRLLNERDMQGVEGKDLGSERMYLQGSFVVTASGPNKAVLRSQGPITEVLGIGGKRGNVRVIVEFPPGARPPSVGASVSRDSRRPFQVIDVKRSEDGQLNVIVREVTRP